MQDTVFFRLKNKIYKWSGWFECQLSSREWFRVPAGVQRVLLNERFTVVRSYREGWKYTTTWTMQLPDDIDSANAKIRAFKKKLQHLI